MKTIDEDIKQGTFRNVYLLYGEEAYLLKQYKDKHWSDTEKIKAEQDQEKKNAMIRQGYDEETIQ